MIVLIIIAAIVFLMLLSLNIPVEAYIKFYGRKLDIRVKYLFLSIYPRKEKPPKKAKKRHMKHNEYPPLPPDDTSENEQPDTPPTADEASSSADSKTNDADDDIPKAEKKKRPPKEEKPPFPDRINDKLDELSEKKNAVSLLLELIGEPLKRFGGKIRIDDIIIDCAIADEDAAKAAVTYGTAGAAVYDGISFLRCFVTMSVKSVNISCLYNTPADKSRFDGECKLHLRPASLVNALLAVLFGYIKDKEKYSPVMELLGKDK